MKYLFVVILLIAVSSQVMAGNINKAVYHTMLNSSYKNNYNRQINNRVIPYWQAQSNFSTRNVIYKDYSNYNNYLYRHNQTKPYGSYR